MKFSRLSLSVSLFALAFASAAFAMPKVGDSATLDGTLVGQGVNAQVTTTQKITAFNVNTGVYTVLQTQTVAGQSQSKETQVDSTDMMSEEMAGMIVQACESQAMGKKETVTVAAGTFDTCRVNGQDGAIIWVGAVPFGVVKLQTSMSVGTISLGMSAFARGN